MKHLRFLPLLIAAAFYIPRAHAAEVLQQPQPSSLSIILICLGLVVLAGAGQRSNIIKPED